MIDGRVSALLYFSYGSGNIVLGEKVPLLYNIVVIEVAPNPTKNI